MINTALLLIDVQMDYFPDGRMEVAGAETALEKIKSLLAEFRKNRQTVIHVQHVANRPGATFFLPDTEGVKIHPAVYPLAGESLVIKHVPNSFRDTELDAVLQAMEINKLIVCGMMSHMCIDATVRAAFDKGYGCTVVHDACATRELVFDGTRVPAPQVHAAYMSALAAVYARVLPADEVLAELQEALPMAD